MRFLTALLILLAVTLGLLYTFGGVKFGLVTITPARMWNAQGVNTYAYLNSGSGIQVSGGCVVSSGSAILRLTDPDGLQVAGQECPKGKWSINMGGKGKLGSYQLNIAYLNYTGTLDVKVAR
jgi:hypothetical protein